MAKIIGLRPHLWGKLPHPHTPTPGPGNPGSLSGSFAQEVFFFRFVPKCFLSRRNPSFLAVSLFEVIYAANKIQK